MSEIDWSKAPEGYNFALSTAAGWDGGSWLKGTVRFAKREGLGHFTCEKGEHPQIGISSWEVIAERPQPWSGEDLPPVGAVCEVKNDIDGWDAVDEVLAHTEIKGAAVAVFKRDDRVFLSPADSFRPIRTPEQIAAEDRENEVDALCYDIVSHYEAPKMSEHYLGLAKALHAAGYRKVTP